MLPYKGNVGILIFYCFLFVLPGGGGGGGGTLQNRRLQHPNYSVSTHNLPATSQNAKPLALTLKPYEAVLQLRGLAT